MYQLAAVFSPGFEKVIPEVLKDVIPDANKILISSGFSRFCVTNRPFRAKNADFFNNVFLVLKEWNASASRQSGGTQTPTFEQMANKIRIPENLLPEILKQNYKSFRLRFSKENVFTSVNKQVMANVEKQISMQTGMKPDRLGGDTEFWFLTRSDGYACFALRMTKKQSTEKYLEKGELRPEFVTLLAAFAGVTKRAAPNGTPSEENESPIRSGNLGVLTILDPFAGHGGIVKRLAEIAPNANIITSEIDADLVKKLSGMTHNVTPSKSSVTSNHISGAIEIHQADATQLNFISNKSVDVIITDPPWGFYQGDLRDDKKLRKLYDGMLKEFYRVIKPTGKICVLTGAKEIFEQAFDDSEFAKGNPAVNGAEIRNDVLVNGKKAAVYVLDL